MSSVSELQIGLDILLGAGSGIIGAVGAYVKLKSRIDLAEAKNVEQERELTDIKERKKEMNAAIHKRIDDQNHTIQDIQKEMSAGHNKLQTELAQLELRIIKEFKRNTDDLIRALKGD